VAAYKKFVEDDKVLLVLGYGTPDTEALRPFITKDKMPYLSGSYSGHLTDPRQTPYNFPGGIDYTSQIRIFLNYVKETWKNTSRKPRMAFIYADNSYGQAPIEAGRGYAKEIGVDLVDEEIIPTVVVDATSQLLTMQKKSPDFVYINTNTQWVPVVLKDSYKLKLKVTYVVNNYGIDERTPRLAGDAAEDVLGIRASPTGVRTSRHEDPHGSAEEHPSDTPPHRTCAVVWVIGRRGDQARAGRQARR
jgi:branched-chain amino acid transport system substrate-binding protein